MKENQYVEFISDVARTGTIIYRTYCVFQVREGSVAEYAENKSHKGSVLNVLAMKSPKDFM